MYIKYEDLQPIYYFFLILFYSKDSAIACEDQMFYYLRTVKYSIFSVL